MEEQLSGGNVTPVVRIGGAVHREAGPWTPTVHALLRRLRARGIHEAPEPLGMDDAGREVLSFLPGLVGNYPLPEWMLSDAVLAQSGRLLRRLHDASVGFDPADAVWRTPPRLPAEVICHNDFAPYNLVFTDRVITGVIDFDLAAPGPRIRDLAYLAYRIVPFLGGPDADAPRRLELLVASYGMTFPDRDLLATMVERLHELAGFTDRRAEETGRHDFVEHAHLYRADAATIAGLIAGPPLSAPS